MSSDIPTPNALRCLSSLANQCADVISVISKYGSYYRFEIIKSVPFANIGDRSDPPYDICMASDDYIFISFDFASSVCRYNSRGKQIWCMFVGTPLQMCVIGCELFVASYSTDGVYVISFDGVILRRITARLPWAITFDSNRKHLIVLSTLSLTAFDFNGKEMWKRDSHRQNGLNYFLKQNKQHNFIISIVFIFSSLRFRRSRSASLSF